MSPPAIGTQLPYPHLRMRVPLSPIGNAIRDHCPATFRRALSGNAARNRSSATGAMQQRDQQIHGGRMISMPSDASGRSRTLTRVRYCACLSRFTVTRPSRSCAEVAGHGNRLQENLRHDHGAAEVHPDAVLPCVAIDAAEMRKSMSDASPRAAPETCGCMWTMSVPRATWTVQGMPAR